VPAHLLMRASASASFCLSVAISAVAVAARSTIIISASRGRANRALPASGLVKIFDDNGGVPLRSTAGIARLITTPGGCGVFPALGSGAASAGVTCHGRINGSFAAQPLWCSQCSCSMASPLRSFSDLARPWHHPSALPIAALPLYRLQDRLHFATI
jgi:hypothetical protein